MKNKLNTRSLLVIPVMLSVFLVGGCAAPQESEGEREAGSSVLGVEACFTNEFQDSAFTMISTYDGSETQWESMLGPQKTVCIKSKNDNTLTGEMSSGHDSQPYSYRFVNPVIGYPNGSLIIGTWSPRNEKGIGICKSFASMETFTMDSGTTRFVVQRLTDGPDNKRFSVSIRASVSKSTPNDGCYYEPFPDFF